MLRNKPRFKPYSGLTIVLSNLSRFDKAELLSSTGSQLFNSFCLAPTFTQFHCDVRVKEDKSPWLEGTKAILLCGESAMHEVLPETKQNTIGEMRGSPFQLTPEIVAIPSFYPQDAADIKDYEGEFNAQSGGAAIEDEFGDEDTESTEDDKRRHGRTKRKNFAFWLKKDVEKCKAIIANGGKIPFEYEKPNYIFYPSSDEIIQLLTKTKGQYLYIDIETDSALNIQCLSFGFSNSNTIYGVPILSYDYSCGYSTLPFIFRALARAFRDNTTVAHNGSSFDFFVFAHKYHIAIGNNVYDTMVASHRCFPEIEKSLGHCTSLWTWEKFHKDEGNVAYNTRENAKQVLEYCCKDVYTMKLIHQAIDKYAAKQIGLRESIEQANRSIRPYLITTLQGIQYKQDKLQETMVDNDRMMMQYLRMLDILVGKETLKEIRGKGKSAMPASNPQCCTYFHTKLGYPIVAYGKERKAGGRAPSLGKKAILKLRLKHENPVIDIIMAYRELAKESGSLKFTPYKEDEVKPTNRTSNPEGQTNNTTM